MMARAACVVLLLAPGLAHAQRGLDEHLPGCDIEDFLERESSTIYACADGRWAELGYEAGAVVLRASGRLPARFAGFVDGADRVDVVIEDRRRVSLDTLVARARVRSVEGRRVRLDRPGIAPGERVRFSYVDSRGNRRAGPVGVVVPAEGDTAVEIGVGERVEAGWRAETTRLRPSADLWAPRQDGNLWELVIGARPFVDVERPAGGVIGSLSLRYRARVPLVLSTEWDPAGIGAGWTGASLTTAAYGLIGVDLGMAELSIGAGITTDATSCCGGVAFALAQRVRLGARDGLHIEATFLEGFAQGGLLLQSANVRAQLPLEPFGGRGLWLVARGAGGTAGYGIGELGVRALLHGGGWRGSLFGTVVAGAAALFRDGFSLGPWQHVGPMLGVDVELRF